MSKRIPLNATIDFDLMIELKQRSGDTPNFSSYVEDVLRAGLANTQSLTGDKDKDIKTLVMRIAGLIKDLIALYKN